MGHTGWPLVGLQILLGSIHGMPNPSLPVGRRKASIDLGEPETKQGLWEIEIVNAKETSGSRV